MIRHRNDKFKKINSLLINKRFVMKIKKFPAPRAGLPGNILCIYIEPFDLIYLPTTSRQYGNNGAFASQEGS
jgi:hypothetical protein